MGVKLSLPGLLLRLEGLAVFAAAIAFYIHWDGNWLLFALLILAPDLSALGYFAGFRVGSVTYDIVHNYALPGLPAALSFYFDSTPMLWIALIWVAHIGADRALGFGLKCPTEFKDTHLSRV